MRAPAVATTLLCTTLALTACLIDDDPTDLDAVPILIHGTVTSAQDRTPVGGAQLRLMGGSPLVTSDDDGRYQITVYIDVAERADTLVAVRPPFETARRPVNLRVSEPQVVVDVPLDPAS